MSKRRRASVASRWSSLAQPGAPSSRKLAQPAAPQRSRHLVRIEVEQALALRPGERRWATTTARRPASPGAGPPHAEELPASSAPRWPSATRPRLRRNPDFDHDINRLIAHITTWTATRRGDLSANSSASGHRDCSASTSRATSVAARSLSAAPGRVGLRGREAQWRRLHCPAAVCRSGRRVPHGQPSGGLRLLGTMRSLTCAGWRRQRDQPWRRTERGRVGEGGAWDTGRVSHLYPWGDTFDKARCNTQRERHQRQTTPVGQLPQRATAPITRRTWRATSGSGRAASSCPIPTAKTMDARILIPLGIECWTPLSRRMRIVGKHLLCLRGRAGGLGGAAVGAASAARHCCVTTTSHDIHRTTSAISSQ